MAMRTDGSVRMDISSVGAIEGERVCPIPPGFPRRGIFGRRRMFNCKQVGEWNGEPVLHEQPTGIGDVRRIGEGDVVTTTGQLTNKLHGLSAMNRRTGVTAQSRDVCLDGRDRTRRTLNKVTGRGTAREGLESKRSATGAQIEHASVGEQMMHNTHPTFPDSVAGRAHVITRRGVNAPASPPAGDDSHTLLALHRRLAKISQLELQARRPTILIAFQSECQIEWARHI